MVTPNCYVVNVFVAACVFLTLCFVICLVLFALIIVLNWLCAMFLYVLFAAIVFDTFLGVHCYGVVGCSCWSDQVMFSCVWSVGCRVAAGFVVMVLNLWLWTCFDVLVVLVSCWLSVMLSVCC